MAKDNPFFTTREETETWLKDIGIENYSINDDLTVDVDGSVWISNMNLDYIPLQFGKVDGDFSCHSNNLKTLKGCPKTVGESFYCYSNELKSLEYAPTTVMDSFSCDNNQLNNLDFMTKNIDGNLCCYNNPITDFSYLDFEVKNEIVFTPTDNMAYLNNYKNSQGDIIIDFNEFKRLLALKQLNEKLTDDLCINTTASKKMKI